MNSNEQRIINQYRTSKTKNTTTRVYLRVFHHKIQLKSNNEGLNEPVLPWSYTQSVTNRIT